MSKYDEVLEKLSNWSEQGYSTNWLINAMIHELRRPLTGIMGTTKYLRMNFNGDLPESLTEEQIVDLLQILEANNERMAEVLEAILQHDWNQNE